MGHANVAKALCDEAGELMFATNEYGDTALHVAAVSGKETAIRELAAIGGAKLLDAKNKKGKTAMEAAQESKQGKAQKLLAELRVSAK